MYVRCYSGPRWTTLFVHIHRHASLADLFRDNYDYKRRQTMAARKRGEGSFSPKWWRNLDPRLIRLEYALNQSKGNGSSRRGNAAAFFHYVALFFCRGQSEPDEGFWRLVVWETCEYESVRREIGTRCGTWHRACRLRGARWWTKLRFCMHFLAWFLFSVLSRFRLFVASHSLRIIFYFDVSSINENGFKTRRVLNFVLINPF